MGARRPRRRYNRNVELLFGILVIVLVVVLLVWLID
jgi:heme/copper-type cytochrome/quinol oxidase subunit 4